jgi:hypothetical protein
MTLVVPQMADNKRWALAPAELYSVISLEFKPFSAACSVVPIVQQDDAELSLLFDL